MKTTYLVRKVQPDGSTCLSIATRDEWLSIVDANKALPVCKQRYFIIDCIPDGENKDCIVVESSAEEFRKWNKERMAASRNRELGKSYQTLSLDAALPVEGGLLTLSDVVGADFRVEDEVCTQLLAEELKTAIAEWRPWAEDMLLCYLRGERRTCTKFLSEKYGVSSQVIRKYKRQFERFIKKFFGGVSF